MKLRRDFIQKEYKKGPAFILPNGDILQGNNLTHIELYKILNNNDKFNIDDLDHDLKELGWIRLNLNNPQKYSNYIDIREVPSPQQLKSLKNILYDILFSNKGNILIFIYNIYGEYSLEEYSPEDIIKDIIKRCNYRTYYEKRR